jgi:elongation factor Ts
MAEITAASVKELRERTSAGMMDCKKALAETNGDMEAAIDWLRAKGLSAAAKKAGRTASEGLVGVAVEGTKGVAVEVNSETDFVAKNDKFQDFVRKVTEVALNDNAADVEALKAAAYPDGGTVSDKLTDNVATIGENQQVRRLKHVSVENGVIVPYMHNAAAFPQALNAEGLDAEVIERERKVAAEKAAESGKPAEVQAKMVDGAISKFAKENALLSQVFVMDNKTPISEVVAKAGKDAGAPIVLKDYVRFQLGEGIEKEETDFAAEVAAAVKG